MKDKNGKTIKAGDTICYKGHYFDVVKYKGFFGEKGRLKIMERKSMFEGATDGWLDELEREENKIEIIKKK